MVNTTRMKIKHLLLGLLSVAALASCSIEEELQSLGSSRHFRAVMEQTAPDASTRAYATYDSNRYFIFWNKGDRISIFYEKTYNREFKFLDRDGNTAGEFGRVGTDPSPVPGQDIESGYEYAVYPYHEENSCDSQGTLTVVLPEQQTYYDDARGIGVRMLMVARDKDGDFTFKHVGSYLGVRLKGENVSVASVSLKGNNGELLAGYPMVSYDENDTPVLTFDSNNSSEIVTLTLDNPVALNPDDYEVFWLTLPPVTFDEGITLTVTDTEGGIYERIISSKITMERRKFYTLSSTAEFTPAALDESSYAYTSTLTTGAKYIIVDAEDKLVFKGNINGSSQSVTPVDGVITDTDGTLATYEFTVEQNGSDYYLIFNDGKYLISNWSSPGNGSTGLCYVDTQAAVRYPYALTTSNGAFMFSTTQVNSSTSTDQVLYYKSSESVFKIGGSGRTIGVHLYQKGGKQDRGLKFEPESVTCFQGDTPEKPILSGTYTTVSYSSDNEAVATVDNNGNVTVIGIGTTTITAEADEDTRYKAGSASYTLIVLDPSVSTYSKASSITVGGTYLILDKDDKLVFKGAQDGSGQSVSPKNGVITDTERALAAYEFTVEKNGNNYYLKFNDGKYLVCNYTASEGGNSTSGICYVNTQADVKYPYTLTVSDGAFFFNTSRADNNSADQYLYYKTSGTNANIFKIGGSGSSTGVHLYMKGGKRDRGLTFEPETVTCLQGNTPEKPVLYGTYTTALYSSENTSVATVDATSGTVTVKGIGTTIITATVDEDDDYLAGTATYSLTVLDPSASTYTKASSITVGGTYLIVDKDDNLVFTGAQTSNSTSVTPKNGVITDTERALAAYEFTVEKSGNNYYLKFNDGKYLVCNYTGSGGNSTSGVCYVGSQNEVTYPYTLTISNGAFFFNTTRTDNNEANQYLYYKTSGTNANVFKIGQSGSSIGIHLYLKGGGGDTPAKQTQTLSFTDNTVTWTLGNGYETDKDYDFPQEVKGAKTPVTYRSLTTDVVTINGNKIHIVKAGSATIRADAAETDEFYGNYATYTLNIASPAPEGWVDKGTINLENAALKAYLNKAETTYLDDNEQTVTCVKDIVSQYSSITRQDFPNPVVITWTNPASSNTVVTIYSDQALSQTVLSPVTAKENATSADVYNLVPGCKYYYTVSENGSIWEKGYFNTTGRRRMLKISDTKARGHANNCRDLGGMVTKDGTKRIKYGYIFRGSNMDKTTDVEKSILYDDLKIRLDIDLRSGSSSSSGSSENGNTNSYRAFSATGYPAMGYLNKGFSSYNDLTSDSGLGRVGDIFNAIIDAVLEEKAVYFHCWVGADRTGFIGLLLEGLLGISEADCSMDYELTSFSVVGLRGRDGSGEDHYWGSKNSPKGLALLRDQTGETFEQKCTNFLTSSKVGVSSTRITQFKGKILESINNNN